MSDEAPKKQRRGFAAMPIERRREFARMGGSAVNPANRSFSKDRALAAEAGRMGGTASRRGPAKSEA